MLSRQLQQLGSHLGQNFLLQIDLTSIIFAPVYKPTSLWILPFSYQCTQKSRNIDKKYMLLIQLIFLVHLNKHDIAKILKLNKMTRWINKTKVRFCRLSKNILHNAEQTMANHKFQYYFKLFQNFRKNSRTAGQSKGESF